MLTCMSFQKVLDTYTCILAPIAPHLAEEITHFATGSLTDPTLDEVNSGSIFEKGWTLPVSEFRLLHSNIFKLTFLFY